jgi:hypothetical protein
MDVASIFLNWDGLITNQNGFAHSFAPFHDNFISWNFSAKPRRVCGISHRYQVRSK